MAKSATDHGNKPPERLYLTDLSRGQTYFRDVHPITALNRTVEEDDIDLQHTGQIIIIEPWHEISNNVAF